MEGTCQGGGTVTAEGQSWAAGAAAGPGPRNAWEQLGCSHGSWTRLLAGLGMIIKNQVSIEKLYCREGL